MHPLPPEALPAVPYFTFTLLKVPFTIAWPNLIAWLEGLKRDLEIPASIQAAGVAEVDFLAKVDEIAIAAFDDQCTGANPRFPLINELKALLLDSYYGRSFLESYEEGSEDSVVKFPTAAAS